MELIAVITGANSEDSNLSKGVCDLCRLIEKAVAERLLSEIGNNQSLRLCLACRNMDKAESARQYLLQEHPTAQIDLLQVDTSSPQSSIAAAQEIKRRYHCIKWFFCNAGIMPIKGLNLKACFTLNAKFWVNLFTTGDGLLTHADWKTQDGHQAVFATNVLGHYIMIKELEDHLINQGSSCHILWTSSNSARLIDVDPSDIEGKNQIGPYPHSKRLMDLVSLDINRRLNSHGIYSDTACPGMVLSQITLAILPGFLWYLLLPIIVMIRLFVTHFITFKPKNGSECLVWLAKQDPASLDHTLKYFSRKPAFAKTYILKEKIPVDEQLLPQIIKELDQVAQSYM